MGWRYNVGLLLIGTVVLIWVTSAEVTQVGALLQFPVLPLNLTIPTSYRIFGTRCDWRLTIDKCHFSALISAFPVGETLDLVIGDSPLGSVISLKSPLERSDLT
jgi:hypothetical protein